MTSPYQIMQSAVDIVGSSAHHANKIAAAIRGTALDGTPYTIAGTNFSPSILQEKFGAETRFGNSSGWVHAEVGCILRAPCTKDAHIFLTDPPCPNCAKNIAEAGIKEVYIDHKGFEKDFALRRGEEFKSMSMRIFAAAGITVFKIHRKEQKIEPVISVDDNYSPPSEYPVKIITAEATPSLEQFKACIEQKTDKYKDVPFALCLAYDEQKDETLILIASPHPSIGYTQNDDLTKEGKYSFILHPVNRLLMTARYYGLSIFPGYIFASQTPSARELINMLGAGYDTLYINSGEKREIADPDARTQLEEAGVFKFLSLF